MYEGVQKRKKASSPSIANVWDNGGMIQQGAQRSKARGSSCISGPRQAVVSAKVMEGAQTV